MRLRSVRLGTRSVEGSGSMVAGQVVWPESSHRCMEARSYVTPVQRLTGDRMTSSEIGHRKKLGILTSSPWC